MSGKKKARTSKSSQGSASSKGSRTAYQASRSAAYSPDKGKKTHQPSPSGGLEKKISGKRRNDLRKGNLDGLVAGLMDGGMSRSEATKKLKAIYSTFPGYESKPLSFSQDSKTYQAILKKLNISLKDFIREGFHLLSALTDTYEGERFKKDIDNGARTIFIPGYGRIPQNAHTLRKHAGEKIAYVGTTDVDAIAKVITYAAKKHGYVNVVGFSDGGLVIKELRKKHPEIDNKVGRYFAVGAQPHYDSRVVNIIGGKDSLALLEKGYEGHFQPGSNVHVIHNAGHAGLMYDKEGVQSLFEIVNSYRPHRAYYFQPMVVTSESIEAQEHMIDFKSSIIPRHVRREAQAFFTLTFICK